MDLTVVAYATLALSLFVSAVKMGGWILNADPRAIINSGRWALIALAALALSVLVWLIATSRWTSAMMLAAFMLPETCRRHDAIVNWIPLHLGALFRETGFDVMAMTPRKARYLWRDHQRYAELTGLPFTTAGVKSHCITASFAKSAIAGTSRTMRIQSIPPLSAMSNSNTTTPALTAWIGHPGSKMKCGNTG